ncbi:MAG: GAF domain-containing protein [Anaerolineae bacterium]|nr:GAF domain-containing protein [Anaerolineae bacterium]
MLEPGRVLDALERLSTQISGVESHERILLRLVETVSGLLAGAHVSFWRVNHDVVQLQATCPPLPEMFPTRWAVGVGGIGAVAQMGRRLTGQAWRETGGAFVQAGYAAGMTLPLRWRGRVQAVLVVADEAADREFTEVDIQAAYVLAQHVAVAWAGPETIADADQLQSALREGQEQLGYIQSIMRHILEEPDIDANLRKVSESLAALGWRRVVVSLFVDDDESDEIKVEHFITVGVPEESTQDYGPYVVPAQIWTQFMARALDHFRVEGLYFVREDDGPLWGANDVLFAPLRLGQDRVSGVIRLEGPVDGRRPTPDDLRPIDILISQAAYIVENARLLAATSTAAEALAEQVEELSMMHRADRELGTHLDIRRIMTLTMDWALRRTGADTGLLMLMTDDKRGLVLSIKMGYVNADAFHYTEQNPMSVQRGIIGRAARTGKTQFVRNVMDDPDYLGFLPEASMLLAVPLMMRGEVLGVVALATTREEAFRNTDVTFLERLGRRAAVALDNARLFRQAEQMADDMTVLYTASRTITSTLERDAMLQRMAQAMAVTLECSSAVIYDYQPEQAAVQVLAVYQVGTARNAEELLPDVQQVIRLDSFPAFQTAIDQQHPLVLRAVDPTISDQDRWQLLNDRIHAMVLMPLVSQDELIGLATVMEGRHDRMFTTSDVFKAETLASQAAIALRQSILFSGVLELERLKSEMIRMASHDLRNPLNNIMGYIELLSMGLAESGVIDQYEHYLENLRRGTQTMRSLLEDLLTLERIESERESAWRKVDFSGVVLDVVEAQRSSAALKQQNLVLQRASDTPDVDGSETQLRQAVANLVGNAIKYTPEEGYVEVQLTYHNGRLQFQVEDNGYGISPERQSRVFERFYRAQEPGTDHIGGTGLGLSLVKTVIERHGGKVWFESSPGTGSTFGFWLPAADDTV